MDVSASLWREMSTSIENKTPEEIEAILDPDFVHPGWLEPDIEPPKSEPPKKKLN